MTKNLFLLSVLLLIVPLHAGPLSMEAREALLLSRFDTDGDGVLSPEERAAAAETLRREKQEARKARNAHVQSKNQIHQRKREIALLQRFDTNGDGVLNAVERARAEEILRQERAGNRSSPQR